MIFRIFAFPFALLILTACGFQPMYGENRANTQFNDIKIPPIADRSGQNLRNELIDRLHNGDRSNSGRYSLKVSPFTETREDFDIRDTSDATRTQLRLRTNMRLIDGQNNKVVLNRSLEAFGSYNILDSQFTTRVSRENARDNAIIDIARQIERQLALYFNQQEK